jgi:energy-converting hydrogenase Eha subunit A
MPSVLALTFDTDTGKWFAQKLSGTQLADGAINSLSLITDNLFAGLTGLGKFADGFWSGSTALGKFGAGLFTADATGRGKFANAFIVSSLVAAGAIGGGHIADGGILSGKYAAQSIRTADLGLGQVVSSIIGANVIGTPHIQNQGILSASIGVAAIGTPHIANAAITSALIAALGVGTGHLAANAVVSGKLASGAIPDASVSEAQLVSGISIDIAETLSEPTTIAAEPVSGHACVLFLSGFAGKRVGVAKANDPNRMPAVGKIGATALASGASMTTNPILSYGRVASPIGSGNVQKLVYVGTDGQPVVTPPSASGSCIQVLGQVADNDGTMFLFPMPNFVQVAA